MGLINAKNGEAFLDSQLPVGICFNDCLFVCVLCGVYTLQVSSLDEISIYFNRLDE